VGDRLDDDRRDIPRVRFERGANVLEVVVAAHERGVDGGLEHAGRVRVAAADVLRRAHHVAEAGLGIRMHEGRTRVRCT